MKQVRPLLALYFLLAVSHAVAASFPAPQGYVNDFAGILDADSRAKLSSLVSQVEKRTTAEIAVVTVQSLGGMSVEEYANRLFQKWGIGKKGKDNGLLVLICPNERKMRVEVGYGLEGVITDGLAGSVIRHDFTPAFKRGDYGEGTVEGVAQLARFVTGTESAYDWMQAHPEPKPEGHLLESIWTTLFLSIFVVIGLTAIGFGITDKVVFLILWGSIFGGVPLAMGTLGAISGQRLDWSAWTLLVMGLLALISGLWLGLRYPKAVKLAKERKGNGWIWGATSGGSGGSFSGGGGGGFGGGSSGGGGASGGW